MHIRCKSVAVSVSNPVSYHNMHSAYSDFLDGFSFLDCSEKMKLL